MVMPTHPPSHSGVAGLTVVQLHSPMCILQQVTSLNSVTHNTGARTVSTCWCSSGGGGSGAKATATAQPWTLTCAECSFLS